MDKNKKAKIESGLLTLLIMALLFLLLWYVYIDAPQQTEEEGIEVAFGDSEDGGGSEPEAVPMPAVPVTQAPPPTPQAPSENDLMVQDDEESLALAKQREEEKKKRAEQEELIRKQREEQARLEAEQRAEQQRIAEEQARKAAEEQAKRDNANNLMAGMFGNNQQGAQGSGTTQGAGQQGSDNPVGQGLSGGNNWKLTGRSMKKLPSPSKDFNSEGVVVVAITVDNTGKVVAARHTEGTTTSDNKLIQLAEAAARQAEFSESETKMQYGTITYRFKLN
ncbi:MAG: TonB family protein [Paludibacteraceae bacterium]|nr:TonB family protein [Paludibacteraceae bacterium]